ncbi:MAG: Gfo/Idh/MocA family oxidoreductase, partial [Pseudomonadota bacterium]|nr:Gfo/Idh/MocA family oxidoreductase [Pseudomonadota bacterium]
MTLNVALLGTGRIAEYGYIPAINKIDDVNIISVLSRSDIKGSEFATKHSIPRAYVEIDDLLADNHLDAVIVCTPDSLHEEQVIKSCRAKKHILCEKPMSTSLKSCENMIAEIEKAGIIFGMAHNNRFNAGLRYIKDLLDSNSIGQVYYARSILTTLQNDPSGWRALGKESKFWAMSATGAHMIDIFRWYFGEPTKMKKVSLSPKFKSINDEITTLSLNFNDRVICDITASA